MPFGQFNAVVISVSQNCPLTKVITYQLAENAEFHSAFPTASTRFHAHLGHNLGQDKQEIWRIPDKAGADRSLKYMISQD